MHSSKVSPLSVQLQIHTLHPVFARKVLTGTITQKMYVETSYTAVQIAAF